MGSSKPDVSPEKEFFFDKSGMDRGRVQGLVDSYVGSGDDGELFLEYAVSESFAVDDGRLKNASFDTAQGFGLRAVAGDATGYAHAAELSEDAIARAGETVRAVQAGKSGQLALPPVGTNQSLYSADNPLLGPDFGTKIKLLEDIDAYGRAKDPRVRQLSCSLSGEWRIVEIIRPGGQTVRDIRPLVRLNVSVIVGEGDRQEAGS